MTINFKVEVNKVQLDRILFAMEKLISAVQLQKNDHCYRCAVDYQQLVIGAITSQKYAPYTPYVKRYKEWKEKYGKLSGFHRLGGDLVKNIKSFKTGVGKNQGWAGGVVPGSMDTGGKSWRGKGDKGPPKSIEFYAGIMEGKVKVRRKQNHPLRKVFEPVRNEYAKGGFLLRGEETLQKIGRNWS